MRLPHEPRIWSTLRVPDPGDPLRVLVSACIAGHPCGIDGTDYGMGGCLEDLLSSEVLKAFYFCPEDAGMGTPRTMPDIHGGDGFDVLDGRAQVKDENDQDLTEPMIAGARAMLEVARCNAAEVAILTDMSAACGSQVISDGCRLVAERRYRQGSGVAAALLQRHGIPVVSQRDFRSLERLRRHVDPDYTIDADAIDHHETPWYRGYFV